MPHEVSNPQHADISTVIPTVVLEIDTGEDDPARKSPVSALGFGDEHELEIAGRPDEVMHLTAILLEIHRVVTQRNLCRQLVVKD